ncbi:MULTISPECIES: hypothetical protein [Serratia]|uniref:hypothetical protein n=1 Tax=Serratia TaxID=613 RepID=UPI0013792B6B|nr:MULTISPECIES: hypothetical protein [Serratia]MDI3198566.1 hypothetical protein [Serratia ureilytica]
MTNGYFFCANNVTGTILMTEKMASTIIPLYDDLAGAEERVTMSRASLLEPARNLTSR